MATSAESNRLIRGLQELFLAFRGSIASTFKAKPWAPTMHGRIKVLTMRNINALDLQFAAELERRRNLTVLSHPRNQVR